VSDKGRFLSRCGESVTWASRNYGARDGVTKWPALTNTNTTILAYFEPISDRNTDMPAGFITENRIKIYTTSLIQHRDQIVRDLVVYDVETDPIRISTIRGTRYFTAILVKVLG